MTDTHKHTYTRILIAHLKNDFLHLLIRTLEFSDEDGHDLLRVVVGVVAVHQRNHESDGLQECCQALAPTQKIINIVEVKTKREKGERKKREEERERDKEKGGKGKKREEEGKKRGEEGKKKGEQASNVVSSASMDC